MVIVPVVLEDGDGRSPWSKLASQTRDVNELLGLIERSYLKMKWKWLKKIPVSTSNLHTQTHTCTYTLTQHICLHSCKLVHTHLYAQTHEKRCGWKSVFQSYWLDDVVVSHRRRISEHPGPVLGGGARVLKATQTFLYSGRTILLYTCRG